MLQEQQNPVLYSERIDKECTINIPNSGKTVSIHFGVEQGDLQVYFDTTSNQPPLKLYPNARWNQRVNPSMIRAIHLKPCKSKNFIVWITMEKIGG